MSQTERIPINVLSELPPICEEKAETLVAEARKRCKKKIVVLDDDPTGVQTVHGVCVYTDWSLQTLRAGFAEDAPMFFILTNSRAMTALETEKAHRVMAANIVQASKESGKDFIVVSRSDSTLRGHYPLETETLRDEIENLTGEKFDGEIIFPFFKEGGRFTLGNIHYIKEGDVLTPAALTEFARDKTFGYHSSHLGQWCEEKTKGNFPAHGMTYIPIESLRSLAIDEIVQKLEGVTNFQKVICNAVDYADVKVFIAAYLRAIDKGKRFLFRSAAAVTKVLGDIPDKPLLTRDELIEPNVRNGGIIVVGSHVSKTTRQLEELKNCRYEIRFIEFDQHRVLTEGGLEDESAKVSMLAGKSIGAGKTTVIYTRRERLDLDTGDKEKQLEISVRISDALTKCVANLEAKPSFIIAKGGITSSDIGTKALVVKRAIVMGQIAPGVPVWMTGPESKFPGMPYIIFPGNVGEISTLREITETLMG